MYQKNHKPGRIYPATNLAPHISRDSGRDPRLTIRGITCPFLYIKEALPHPIKNAAQSAATPCTATK